MSTNQTLGTKMLGALELANPVTVTSSSGVLTLTAETNSFIAEGTEAITSIIGAEDVTQGIYAITWNTVRTLTYNSVVLQLIGQADRVTKVGDVGIYQLNDGVVTELSYMPVTGYAEPVDLDNYLPLVGGTMSGAIAMSSNKITGLANGTASGDAVNYGQFGASLAANGYQKLPSGLIIQWGYSIINVSGTPSCGTGTFDFSIAFPNACLQIAGSHDNAATTSTWGYAFGITTTASQLTIGTRSITSNGSGTVGCRWIAVGY